MDVVGTASAVLGILQVGFSLAKTIRETVKDYKDAADDLISLAQGIESTLYLVSQLDRLVVDNKKTGTFNDGGLAELNRCLKNTEQIVEALVELLTKTGIFHPPGTKVKPEDLIISRAHRRKWLGQKSRVKDKQDELNKVRLEVTTIILLRDTLQADPSANKAMQQALITAERDRRRKARARRKKQNGNGQVRQPRPNAHKITTGRSPTRINIPPPPSIISRSGRRGFESFAYRAEGSSSGPNKEIATKRAMSRSDRANGSPGSNKVMIEKDLAEEDANATTASENVANGKKRTGNPVDENTTSGNTAYANVADLGSDVAVDSAVPRLASGNSPAIQHSVHQRQPQLSREAIIEEFKRQVKADGIKLSEAYQAMMEPATKSLEHDESDHGLRKFLEAEYAQEWAGERDARDPRRYGGTPDFARPGYGPLADRISPDRTPVDRTPVARMPVDRTPIERMPVVRTLSYQLPQARYSMPRPDHGERFYPQTGPRDRNGYPPLSEELHSDAFPARMSAHLPGEFLNYDRRSRPDRSSSESTESFWSAPADSSDGFGGRRFAYSSPGDHREHFAHRRPNSLRSDDVESGDESDDSLDDDELYDQLLRKFTGHGMRERETADGMPDGDVNGGTDEDVDGNADQDVTGDESNHVEPGGADKIIAAGADDRAIERDDKNDDENLYR